MEEQRHLEKEIMIFGLSRQILMVLCVITRKMEIAMAQEFLLRHSEDLKMNGDTQFNKLLIPLAPQLDI